MCWKKTSEHEDKQGGTWSNYRNEETDEKIVTRTSPDGDDVAIFKDGEKVNRKNQ